MRYNRALSKFQEWSGTAWIDRIIGIAGGGTGATDITGVRTALGLGTMSTQNNNAVTITGGTITNLSALTVAGDVSISGKLGVGSTSEGIVSAGPIIANHPVNAFTAKGAIHPCFTLEESSQGPDLKNWRIIAYQGEFRVETVNDSINTVLKTHISIGRAGAIKAASPIYISYGAPVLRFIDEAQPPDSRIFAFTNVSQTLYIQSTNDAATVAQGQITLDRVGGLTVNNLVANNQIIANGPLTTQANLYVTGNIHTTGQIYPGRIDITGTQSGWYLASHGSYGLYSNTGLYCVSAIITAGNLTASGSANITGNISAGGQYWEMGRSVPIGNWQDVPFNPGNFIGAGPLGWTVAAGNVQINRVAFIGKTMIWTCRIGASTLSGSAWSGLYVNVPFGVSLQLMVAIGKCYNAANQVINLEGSGPTLSLVKAEGGNFGAPDGTFYVYWTVIGEVV